MSKFKSISELDKYVKCMAQTVTATSGKLQHSMRGSGSVAMRLIGVEIGAAICLGELDTTLSPRLGYLGRILGSMGKADKVCFQNLVMHRLHVLTGTKPRFKHPTKGAIDMLLADAGPMLVKPHLYEFKPHPNMSALGSVDRLRRKVISDKLSNAPPLTAPPVQRYLQEIVGQAYLTMFVQEHLHINLTKQFGEIA